MSYDKRFNAVSQRIVFGRRAGTVAGRPARWRKRSSGLPLAGIHTAAKGHRGEHPVLERELTGTGRVGLTGRLFSTISTRQRRQRNGKGSSCGRAAMLDPDVHRDVRAVAGLRVSAHVLIRRDAGLTPYVPLAPAGLACDSAGPLATPRTPRRARPPTPTAASNTSPSATPNGSPKPAP
jgi:hypothetical protein